MAIEQTLRVDTIYRGKFTFQRIVVRFRNGAEGAREVLLHPGAVVLVPVDDAGNILLIRQFRKAVERFVLELPAGTLDPDEGPDVCAARELAEETGHAADLVRLGGFFAAPGYSTEYLHCYLARNLREAAGVPDDDEDIELVPTPLREVRRMIAAGELDDAKTLAGLALALPHLETDSA